MKWSGIAVLAVLVFSGAGENHARAQEVRTDSIRNRQITALRDTVQRDLVFEVIEIQGEVEKPGVIIIPRRLEPELNQVELERSFKKEMKDGIGEIPKPTQELKKVDRVESIKKAVQRKRK